MTRDNEFAMTELDGSKRAAVSLLTGFSASELEDLGGVPEDTPTDRCPRIGSGVHLFLPWQMWAESERPDRCVYCQSEASVKLGSAVPMNYRGSEATSS